MSEKAKESQSEKFKQLAHEVEADEDEATFKRKLKRLAKAKPSAKADKVSKR